MVLTMICISRCRTAKRCSRPRQTSRPEADRFQDRPISINHPGRRSSLLPALRNTDSKDNGDTNHTVNTTCHNALWPSDNDPASDRTTRRTRELGTHPSSGDLGNTGRSVETDDRNPAKSWRLGRAWMVSKFRSSAGSLRGLVPGRNATVPRQGGTRSTRAADRGFHSHSAVGDYATS